MEACALAVSRDALLPERSGQTGPPLDRAHEQQAKGEENTLRANGESQMKRDAGPPH
jgi:hypothetical protein